MKTLLCVGFAVLQASAPTPVPKSDPMPDTAPSPMPAIVPWNGTLAEGLAEVKRLAEAEDSAEALAVVERLLEPNAVSRWREGAISKPGWKRMAALAAGPLFEVFGVGEQTDAERATIHHARGVVLAQSGEQARPEAASAFEQARALAGPGELRLDATYDAGWVWLAEGETFRAKIPEIAGPAGATPNPALPPAGSSPLAGPAGSEPSVPDPLDLARAAYLRARERFVDRLKLEASDADTRANTELVQRRLRELEEIARKREEEKQKQEQEQKDEDPKDSKDPQKDEQQKPGDEKKDPDSKPDEPPKPEDSKPDEKPPEDQKDAEPEPADPSEPKDPKQDAQQKPAPEELLTREEVMRLLDVLKNREAEGKKLQEQLRSARRVAVKKDW